VGVVLILFVASALGEIVIWGTVEESLDGGRSWGSGGGDHGNTRYLEENSPRLW